MSQDPFVGPPAAQSAPTLIHGKPVMTGAQALEALEAQGCAPGARLVIWWRDGDDDEEPWCLWRGTVDRKLAVGWAVRWDAKLPRRQTGTASVRDTNIPKW